MEYIELIDAFTAKCGLEHQDAKGGVAVFEIDDMTVGIIHDREADAVTVVAEIGEPNRDAEEACCSAFLKANYLFAGTGGATLCRNPETGAFAITRSWQLLSLDSDTFTTALNDLLTVAEKWKAVVEGIDEAQDARDEQIEGEREIFDDGFGGNADVMRV